MSVRMNAEAKCMTISAEKRVIGVRIRFDVGSVGVTERKGFHLAMLIDTSGSMEGARIETVKKTLHVLIPMLGAEDSISLISYNGVAQVLCANERRHEELRRIVGAMEVGGMTNMEAGILRIAELPTSPSAVLLLTDGRVNRGLLTAAGLNALFGRVLPRHVPIYTLGYGEDHNIDILRAIAVESRGSYTFAETAETIPETMGSLVGSLVDEAARSVVLKWETESISCLEVGWKKGQAQYFVGNMVFEKDQWIVLECSATEADMLHLEFSWNAADGKVERRPLVVRRSGQAEENEIRIQWLRARHATLFELLDTPTILTEIEELERDILASDPAVQDSELMMRAFAHLQEMKETAANRNLPGDSTAHYRLAADMTTYAMQRGALSFWDHIPGGSPMAGEATAETVSFTSPTQRAFANTTVSRFSQAPVGE